MEIKVLRSAISAHHPVGGCRRTSGLRVCTCGGSGAEILYGVDTVVSMSSSIRWVGSDVAWCGSVVFTRLPSFSGRRNCPLRWGCCGIGSGFVRPTLCSAVGRKVVILPVSLPFSWPNPCEPQGTAQGTQRCASGGQATTTGASSGYDYGCDRTCDYGSSVPIFVVRRAPWPWLVFGICLSSSFCWVSRWA